MTVKKKKHQIKKRSRKIVKHDIIKEKSQKILDNSSKPIKKQGILIFLSIISGVLFIWCIVLGSLLYINLSNNQEPSKQLLIYKEKNTKLQTELDPYRSSTKLGGFISYTALGQYIFNNNSDTDIITFIKKAKKDGFYMWVVPIGQETGNKYNLNMDGNTYLEVPITIVGDRSIYMIDLNGHRIFPIDNLDEFISESTVK